MSPHDGSRQKLRNCVLLKLCSKNRGLFFPDTAYIIMKALNGFLMAQA